PSAPEQFISGLRRLALRGRRNLNRRDEPVAKLRKCFDKGRGFGGITQGFPKSLYRGVQTRVEIDKCVTTPERSAQFLAGDELAWPVKQLHQDEKRLILNLDAHAAASQFMRTSVDLECAESVHEEERRGVSLA